MPRPEEDHTPSSSSSAQASREEGVIFSNVVTKGSTQQPIINTQIAFKDNETAVEAEPKKITQNVDQYFREVQEKDEFEIAEEHQQACPEETANIFSRISFWWFNGLMKTGYSKVLQMSDLHKLRKEEEAGNLSAEFHKNWEREADKVRDRSNLEGHELGEQAKTKKQSKPSLLYAIHKTYGPRFYMAGLLKIVYDISQLVSPLVVKSIIGSIRDAGEVPWFQPYLLVLALFLLQTLGTLFIQQYFHIVMTQGMRLKTGLSAAIYKKSLKLSNAAKLKLNSGDVINFMAIDSNKLCGLVTYLHMVWSGVFQIAVCLIMLFSLIGWSTIAGFAIIIVVIPLNGLIARVVARIRKVLLKFTGERIKMVNEVIQGIRIIKFYAWELSFIKKIMEIRNKEIWKVTQTALIGIATSMLMSMAPLFVGIVTFAIYAATGNILDAEVIFPSLSYFNLIRFPTTFLPSILALLAEARVSLDRIQNYLLAEETEETPVGTDSEYPVIVENGNFVWKGAQAAAAAKAGANQGAKKPAESKTAKLLSLFKKKKSSTPQLTDTAPATTGSKTVKEEKKKYNKLEDEGDDQVRIELSMEDNEEEEKEAEANQQGGLQFVDDDKKEETKSTAVAVQENNSQKKDEIKPDFRLKDINITVKRGDLVVIVGLVGSGKSSLLSALIGEMFKENGNLQVSGQVAYVPQQAWIRNATVRDNILFGKPFNSERYQQTIEACSLEHDLEVLTAGDLTEIGEKGINISGGQKQRVNLARAVYADADVYLFDDVLSALDQHVGRSVFQNCICGLLQNKTRVLVTHQWQYLKDADHIIIIQDGKIMAQGTHQELGRSDSPFSSMLKSYFKMEHEEEKEEEKGEEKEKDGKAAKKNNGKLMSTEDRAEGSVKFSVYKSYVQYAGGYFVFGIILLLYSLTQASNMITNWFLAEWSNVATTSLQPDDGRDRPTQFFVNQWLSSTSVLQSNGGGNNNHDLGYNLPMYIGIYIGLGVGAAILTFFQELTFGLSGLKASKRLHNKALERIMNAPTVFFDTNPAGRIINRFSKDTESIDSSLIGTLKMLMSCLFQVIGTLLLIGSVNYLFLIPIFPILFIYYYVQKYYRSTSRELKRLDSISRSPLFAHFGETLTGVATIRAYRRQEDFMRENEKLLDRNNRAYFAQLVSQRWLAFRLELVGAMIVLFAALSGVIGGSSSAMAGLTLTYALSLTSTASWLVRCAVEAEAAMNSVERVLYYCEEIPQEAPKSIESTKPPEDWPQKGEIELRNVYLKYREELDFVLRDLSLHINPRDKVGIIGRTGCGKSTLMLALFRITEISQGQIIIDGVDVGQIGLHDLRKKLAIIPQDPVMFSGTLRFNLDPFNEFEDYQIWQALERAHIKEKVLNLEGQLDAKVAEYGENFSLGERQLFCVARAILRKTKILIMDEATASVDIHTDALLQQTVRTEFSDRTVLTVAHRLNTIIDSDRILGLKAGEVAEFDSPKNLLTRQEPSIFASLIEETGKANASYLKSIVLEGKDYLGELKKAEQQASEHGH
ncbi:hypothetical protein C9374_002539 [Naegleria lovaniensis]|uniref:Uncharacterized protein n=1 Tax=Naegleria lovaniensis TaxID=51637 RepID=A0AA88KKT4_NAELO|nr:uncharacterized protein C9374_002539 [Naegleria lovaniensis]KAG2386093.1 hypothetical protein C9374_002539 [Naegleria lovaniensis]